MDLLFDECVEGAVYRAVAQSREGARVERAQDHHIAHAHDDELLDWAAARGFVVVTSDRNTMVPAAWERVALGRPVPGLLVIRRGAARGAVFEALTLIAERAVAADLDARVVWVPERSESEQISSGVGR